MEMSIHNKTIAQLRALSESLNPGIVREYGEAALAVWCEGGEWPQFDESFRVPVGEAKRDVAKVYERPPTLKMASLLLSRAIAAKTDIGITMECGAQKSTTLVYEVYRQRLAPRLFVQQTSHVTATGLASYMANKYTDIDISAPMVKEDTLHRRAIYYVGPGVMMRLILTGAIHSNDLVIVDEAQATSAVHDLNLQLLSSMPNCVVSMTASVSHVLTAPKGVVIREVDSLSREVSDKLAKYPTQSAVVGVYDNTVVATPANALVGSTHDIRVLYDTGLRPDPRVTDSGQLVEGERPALLLEFIQTAGRLGRLGKRGEYFYTSHAQPLPAVGESFYDRIHNALSILFKRPDEWDLPVARDALTVWKSNGKKGCEVAATDVEFPADTGSVQEVDSSSDIACSEPSAPVTPLDESSFRGGFVSVTGGDDVAIDGATLVDKEIAVGQSAFVTSRRKSRDYNMSVAMWRERSAKGANVSLTMQPSARHAGNDKRLVRGALSECDEWRVVVPDDLTGGMGLHPLLYQTFDRLRSAYCAGQTLAVGPFPTINDNVCASDGVADDARRVLAGRLLPSYTEREAQEVLRWFNRSVCDINADSSRVQPFCNYFINFANRVGVSREVGLRSVRLDSARVVHAPSYRGRGSDEYVRIF